MCLAHMRCLVFIPFSRLGAAGGDWDIAGACQGSSCSHMSHDNLLWGPSHLLSDDTTPPSVLSETGHAFASAPCSGSNVPRRFLDTCLAHAKVAHSLLSVIADPG